MYAIRSYYALDFYIFTNKKQTLSAALPKNWQDNWHNIKAVYDGKEMKLS